MNDITSQKQLDEALKERCPHNRANVIIKYESGRRKLVSECPKCVFHNPYYRSRKIEIGEADGSV